MKFSPREWILMLVTAAVVIFGVTVLALKPRFEVWREQGRTRRELLSAIEKDRALINERERWESELRELSKLLPQFPYEKEMEVHWLSLMDRLASKHGVRITRRETGEEEKQGLVYELPIECREWEADLESFLRFLFDLQDQGAMLEVRRLFVKQKNPSVLRGRFTLYCSYTKAAPQE
ncbi:MAG: hypothetical protein R6V03_06410 [Kiritimatiellia bacterium]